MTRKVAELARIMAGEAAKLNYVAASSKRVVKKIIAERENNLMLNQRQLQALMLNGRSVMRRLSIWSGEGSKWFWDIARPKTSDPRMDEFANHYMENSSSLWRLGEKLYGGDRSIMWGLGNQAVELGLGDSEAKTVIFLLRELEEVTGEVIDTIKRMNRSLISAQKLMQQEA